MNGSDNLYNKIRQASKDTGMVVLAEEAQHSRRGTSQRTTLGGVVWSPGLGLALLVTLLVVIT